MHETSELSEILKILRATKPRLIGIDGVDGSGKSTLALSLSKELGWPHIDLDNYLDKNLGQYVNHIYYDTVQGRLDDAKEPIIIEGVCLLAILKKLQRSPDMLIYIKRVSDYGSWRDEDDCHVTENIDEFINKKKQELKKFMRIEAHIEGKAASNDVDFPELDEEIIRYHYCYRPYEKAHIIYKRINR